MRIMRAALTSLAAVALGTVVAVSEADARSAQKKVDAAFEKAGTPSTTTLIECIQDAFRELAEGTFQTDMQFRTITRTLGMPDVTTTGEAVFLHKGTDFRFESEDDVIASSPAQDGKPAFEGAVHERLVFVRRGDELRGLHEGVQVAPGEFLTQGFRIDLSAFDPEVQEKITGPFSTLRKFDLLNAATEVSVRREVLQGEFVYVLRTEGEAAALHDHNITFATFFVDPASCLVQRMEEHIDQFDTETFVTFEGDFTYEAGITVPRRTFNLRLPPGAVDLTDDPVLLEQIERQLAHEETELGLN